MKLGSKVKDKITGLEGLLTGRASYITGCDQYLVQPPIKDGDYKEGKWFDEGRLIVLEENVIASKDVSVDDGGSDIAAPVK